MSDQATERIFQDDIIRQLLANGWLLGTADKYNRELALYPEDALGFVQETQDAQWQKFCANHPKDAEQKFLQLRLRGLFCPCLYLPKILRRRHQSESSSPMDLAGPLTWLHA